MANTYTSLNYHFSFSTKNREPWTAPEIENRVWAYIGGIARHHKMIALRVGGIEDHVHALVMAPPTLSPSEIAQYLKGESSKWIHEEFPKLPRFEWQDGYGGFTVSKSQIPEVITYIRNQREHHRKKTFQEEYLELLKKHDVDYDERLLVGMIQASLRDAIGISRPVPALKGRPKVIHRYAAKTKVPKTADLATVRESRVNAAERNRNLNATNLRL